MPKPVVYLYETLGFIISHIQPIPLGLRFACTSLIFHEFCVLQQPWGCRGGCLENVKRFSYDFDKLFNRWPVQGNPREAFASLSDPKQPHTSDYGTLSLYSALLTSQASSRMNK